MTEKNMFLQLKKNLKKDYTNFPSYRIAILGDSSTQFLNQAIKGYGYEVSMNFDVFESDFDQIEQEVFNPTSRLYSFKPDYILIFHSTQKLLSKFYDLEETKRISFAISHLNYVSEIVQAIKKQTTAAIIYANFIEINDYVFGNFANKYENSFLYQLRKANFELMKLATNQKNFFINDVASLSNAVGSNFAINMQAYINADISYSLDFSAQVAKNTVDIILPLTGKLRKCLILDLDNTLWGGVIGDDGLSNIEIGKLGIGKAFTEFQKWIKQLQKRGIILAICSKNTEELAKEPFKKHPDMVLRLDDISLFVANWETKVDNIRYIQSVLNIGFDSMVFLDDSPFEREQVRLAIPSILVPELPDDPAEYLNFLCMQNLFETASISAEDIERTQQYQSEIQRINIKRTYASEGEYLDSLAMRSHVMPFNQFNTPRVAQLTQRSNQFNVRTIRYTEEDIYRFGQNYSQFLTYSFDLSDRFGDNGLIAVVILEKKEDTYFIDTWVMSCRVLKRGMEQFIMNTIVDDIKATGVNQITAEYIPTKKNTIVKDLFAELQFLPENGLWRMNINDYIPFKTYIHAK